MLSLLLITTLGLLIWGLVFTGFFGNIALDYLSVYFVLLRLEAPRKEFESLHACGSLWNNSLGAKTSCTLDTYYIHLPILITVP